MREPELAIKDDENGEATTRIQPADPADVLDILEDGPEDTTLIHRYQPETPRVGWLQRVLNWIKGA